MPIVGHVKAGVIIPDEACDLPDDTRVWLVPVGQEDENDAAMKSHKLWLEMRRIAERPLEGPGGFSGKDHDKVLYGEP